MGLCMRRVRERERAHDAFSDRRTRRIVFSDRRTILHTSPKWRQFKNVLFFYDTFWNLCYKTGEERGGSRVFGLVCKLRSEKVPSEG